MKRKKFFYKRKSVDIGSSVDGSHEYIHIETNEYSLRYHSFSTFQEWSEEFNRPQKQLLLFDMYYRGSGETLKITSKISNSNLLKQDISHGVCSLLFDKVHRIEKSHDRNREIEKLELMMIGEFSFGFGDSVIQRLHTMTPGTLVMYGQGMENNGYE